MSVLLLNPLKPIFTGKRPKISLVRIVGNRDTELLKEALICTCPTASTYYSFFTLLLYRFFSEPIIYSGFI